MARPYSPKSGPHAGETFPSYYNYRTNVVARDQGYASYADQQTARAEARALGIPVSSISANLRRTGASNVEAIAIFARMQLVEAERLRRAGRPEAGREALRAADFAVLEINAIHPELDEGEVIFPDSP